MINKIQIIWPITSTDVHVDVNFDGSDYSGMNPAFTNYMSINGGQYFVQLEKHPTEDAIHIGDRATVTITSKKTRYPYRVTDAAYWQGEELEFLSGLKAAEEFDLNSLSDLSELPEEDEFNDEMVPWGNTTKAIGSTDLWIQLEPA